MAKKSVTESMAEALRGYPKDADAQLAAAGWERSEDGKKWKKEEMEVGTREAWKMHNSDPQKSKKKPLAEPE